MTIDDFVANDPEFDSSDNTDDLVAVVGMAGRYPESPNLDVLWDHLVAGDDCVHRFSAGELLELGIPQATIDLPNFVPRGTRIDRFDHFDAARFGLSPREAAMTDPQARLFLETAHQALEHAGYDPFAVPGEVGVFAGCNPIDYALLLGSPDPTDSLTAFDQMIGNDRDFLATRVSHRLGLTGPAINVQTACSTSLVAVHMAAQHLLEYQCSAALAGGVSLNFRQGVGYFYQQGMILSPDGYCRAFDNKANGTVLGQGAGVVVLKRLSDAISDGDTVHAVIAASALNNDGAGKASYTAPSVDGQAEVIATTHALAGLDATDITYIETHGTGTHLGDPVEVAGLTKAFALSSDEKQYCAIGSVKTNLGHTDAAAGVTGFIKAVLAVREGVIPKSLHYDEPNAAINFAQTPFYVATETTEWNPETTDKRRAGISSFGIGGTNAHVIVEEPPVHLSPAVHRKANRDSPARPHLLVASAPSADGATATADQLAVWAQQRLTNPDVPPIDSDEIATLLHGRRRYRHRAATVVASSGSDIIKSKVYGGEELRAPKAVWMFSGQGAQVPAMAHALVDHYPVFRQQLESILDQFAPFVGPELAPLVLDAPAEGDSAAAATLAETRFTQPALFAFQVAMARQLQAWGLQPSALLGHSIGEYAAAVIAGVLSVDDGVKAVAARGELMWAMEPGVMLSVRLGRDELAALVPDDVDVAVSNSTSASVAAGSAAAIDRLQASLQAQGISSIRLATSHAFHSSLMAPAADQFAATIGQFSLAEPQIPMLSNVSGGWFQPGEATDPHLWAKQIRQEVRFSDCLHTLATEEQGDLVFVEVGPGRALSSFVAAHESFATKPVTVQCLARPGNRQAGVAPLEAAGQLWTAGFDLDWQEIAQVDATNFRRRPVPTSVLTGDRHWLPETRHVLALAAAAGSPLATPTGPGPELRRLPVDQWCYGRSWSRRSGRPVSDIDPTTQRVLVLTDESPFSQALVAEFTDRCHDVIEVRLDTETDLTGDVWTLAPADNAGTRELISRLTGTSRRPDHVVHAWLAGVTTALSDPEAVSVGLDIGVNTLLALARGLAPISQDRAVTVSVATFDAFDVTGVELVDPIMSAVAGPVKVVPLEYSGISARQIDLPRSALGAGATSHSSGSSSPAVEVSAFVREVLDYEVGTPMLALRGRYRWEYEVEPLRIDPAEAVTPRDGGTYIIFGGTGGVGLALAEHLARRYRANIVLTSRSGEPRPSADDPEATLRAERLAAARTSAAEVLVLTADAASLDDTRQVVSTTVERFGTVDGVIFTAAVADNSGAIHRRSAEAHLRSIEAKVFGAVNLAAALEGHSLDFVMLSSSIASQLYHNRFGQVGYVTANSFAEAMAEAAPFDARRVITVAWDDWMDAGMSVRAAQDFSQRFDSGDPDQNISLMDEIHSFTADDGVQLFYQALGVTSGAVFVSTTDLPARVRADVDEVNPFLTHAVGQSSDEEPDGEAERDVPAVVLASWAGLLGISEVGDGDDFFDLGGDSLQVARMVDRLSRDLRLDIPLDVVFDNPRFGDLVGVLEQRLPTPSAPATAEAVGPMPLSPPQRRFLARGSARPEHFNVSVLLRPSEPVTHSQMQAAIDALVHRHSALRTAICPMADGQGEHPGFPADTFHQVVTASDEARFTVGYQDFRSLNTDETPARVEAHCVEQQRSYRLDEPPLAACVLFDLPDGEQRVFLGAHHLVSDRISLLALIDELDRLLLGEELSSAPTSYGSWSQAIYEWANSDESETALNGWKNLVPNQGLRLPIHSDQPNTNALADAVKVELDAETSASLLRGGGRTDTRVLLAVAQAVKQWAVRAGGSETVDSAGNLPVGIDVISHGRRDLPGVDVGRTIGFFLSYSPLWIQPETDTADVLAERLQGGWAMDSIRARFPDHTAGWDRPQILFNYVGRPIETGSTTITVMNEPKGSDTAPDNVRDHDIAIMAEVTSDDRLVLTLVYGTARIDSAEIERLATILQNSAVATVSAT